MIIPKPYLADAGDLSRERLIFKAVDDLNLTYFAAFSCRIGSKAGNFRSGDIPDAFWFDDKDIKKGDFVVLYTKNGKRSEKASGDVTSHFFYWKRTEAIWTPDRQAVLAQTSSWKAVDYAPSESDE